MYGKASTQISPALAELRANPEINKMESMFDEYKISMHYQKFQEMAMQLLETQKFDEEEKERQQTKTITQ